MAPLEVSARQFRENQKSFFEMADSGKQVVIRRGRKQAYILMPVEENDFRVTPELLTKLDAIRQQVKEGEYTECVTVEEALNHLESL